MKIEIESVKHKINAHFSMYFKKCTSFHIYVIYLVILKKLLATQLSVRTNPEATTRSPGL